MLSERSSFVVKKMVNVCNQNVLSLICLVVLQSVTYPREAPHWCYFFFLLISYFSSVVFFSALVVDVLRYFFGGRILVQSIQCSKIRRFGS